jgi:hypothetical protein
LNIVNLLAVNVINSPTQNVMLVLPEIAILKMANRDIGKRTLFIPPFAYNKLKK